MYDPEFSLRMDGCMKQLYASMERIKNMVPENHPLAALAEAFVDAFEELQKVADEYNNCFDEEKREGLKADAKKMISALQEQFGILREVLGKD